MHVNLPKTSFPLKAKRELEPDLIAASQKTFEGHSGRSEFVLHDGPPYANGDIHMGHVLNKVLKDIEARSRRHRGIEVEFVPGFDCHGLPIEVAVEAAMRKAGRDASPAELRAECRKFADDWIVKQTESFKSLGIAADWDRPYKTMSKEYEAKIVEVFAELYKQGYLFQEERIVPWSPDLGTALADSEIHHKDITEDAIYVKLPIVGEESSYVLVWTTTPWSLIANKAVAFNPDMIYYQLTIKNKETQISSKYLVIFEQVHKVLPFLSNPEVDEVGMLGQLVNASYFQGMSVVSPLTGETVPMIPADFVDNVQGTGFVHIAPAFGEDDFKLGKAHGLDTYCPVGKHGRWVKGVGQRYWEGLKVLSCNQDVIVHLDKGNLLVATEKHTHSYPHDDRLDKKVIYRSSQQWFMDLDHNGLRHRIADVIDEMEWDSVQAKETAHRMVADRPPWCISRQKSWGVGLPVFYNEETGAIVANEQTFEAVRKLTEEHGSDAWFTMSPEDILPEDFVDPETGSTPADLVKEESILSVWFDSAISHLVLKGWPEEDRNIDFVCEGIDQYGSWFQVSIILSTALLGAPPFKRVVAHGFVLDGKGQAMSKSKGNVIAPQKLIEKYGTDVVRLWAASADTSKDIRVSDEILQGVKQDYFTIRNFLRFCLGNTADYEFDILPGAENFEEWKRNQHPLDFYFSKQLRLLIGETFAAYTDREYHKVVKLIREFIQKMNVEYLDAVKDVLYCDQPDSYRRREVQRLLFIAAVYITKRVEPILPLLAQEVMAIQGDPDKETMLFGSFHDTVDGRIERTDFAAINRFRDLVFKEQERMNEAGSGIKPIESLAFISLTPTDASKLMQGLKSAQQLAEMYAISAVQLFLDVTAIEPHVRISKAPGSKCDRCWKIVESTEATKDGIFCPRCLDAEAAAIKKENKDE